MFKKMKDVYHLLGDDESKEIFKNRVLWNLSGERKHINKIVDVYFERMKRTWTSPEHMDAVKNMRHLIGKRKVIVYGIGNCGLVTLALLCSQMQDIELIAFCDKVVGQVTEFHGYRVIRVEDIVRDYGDAAVLITPVNEKLKKEIIYTLIENGVNKNQIVEELPFDDWVIREQYFDKVITLDQGEVFIDAGAFNCGTDIDFIKRCPDYKEIIAFEPDPELYMNCLNKVKTYQMRDIKIHNIGLWSKKEMCSFLKGGAGGCISDKGTLMVRLDTLDHMLSERVSFIKMDIEGAELKALKGAQNTIMNYKPKLAICVYHKPEDIIEIPLYLHKIVPEYAFYLRHHSKGDGETVLYAVIK